MFITPLILFIVAGVGIVTLVSLKAYQLSRGVQLPMAAKRNAVEGRIRKFERGVKRKTANVKSIFSSAGMWKMLATIEAYYARVTIAVKNALTGPGHWLDRNTRNLVSLVRGRQTLSGRDTPSSYLRDISRP